MAFKLGMTCCNPHREKLGLTCDVNQQIACASTALAWCAEHAPDDIPQQIATLINAFPGRLAAVGEASIRAAVVDAFIACSAKWCAALPTRTERHAFRSPIAALFGAEQIEHFDAAMSAEWHRLRGR